MEIRFAIGKNETKSLDTDGLRNHFLVDGLFQPDILKLVYSHHDRVIIGGVMPSAQSVELGNPAELRADYFLERRELGIINLGGHGEVHADGQIYPLQKLECLYLGKGVQHVSFVSQDNQEPAKFYLLSAPAHQSYPTTKFTREEASPVNLGEAATSNKRTVYKYIHKDGIKSCQLVMGLTVLESGSVWNSVPPHTHTRRMEVYLYFDLDPTQRLFHFMGEPQETRHIVMANDEAVISPPWSMHFGCGTSNYAFVWGMAGENLDYTDMDPAPIPTLK
ncbi:MAG: 5-dehydro-4-deoxy-D-glucuronate isomerase [Bacteroidota bacterium]